MAEPRQMTQTHNNENAKLVWWARTGVCLIGVVFLGLSVPRVVNALTDIVFSIIRSEYGLIGEGPSFGFILFAAFLELIRWNIGDILQAVLGYWCLTCSGSVAHRITRGLVGHCWHCGYSLEDLQVDACPECGAALESTRQHISPQNEPDNQTQPTNSD
ncbi:MAG: hypothetical protein H6815_00215 [Phycisphaeraceae bacterium]|nr:hypothetical protein [Phycisphaerales bacterium]MCB9858849.1 hypothetical protein [Phycisphaeraceae bacterium]